MTKRFGFSGRHFFILAVVNALLASTALAAAFPPPSGPFNTSLVISQLIDHTRLDPYSPTPTPRSLMVSIFHPSKCNAVPAPYMDPITAAWTDSQLAPYGIKPGTFESLHLNTCPFVRPCYHDSHAETGGYKEGSTAYPVLLFSPGLGEPRLFYSALAQETASHGYTVVAIDHPYDAGIVVYPDNSAIVGANITTDDQILFDLAVRAKDISFVLDQIANLSLARSLGFQHANTDQVGIFGHSLGGATAAEAMLQDSRLVGGINLDGSFFGSVIEIGLSEPFLLFAHAGKNLTADASWEAIWPKLRGFKHILELEDSTHGTFLDFLAVIDVLGLKDQLPSEVGELLGTIDGMRALKIMGTYIGAFFDRVIKGERAHLLDGPSKKYPEVIFGDLNQGGRRVSAATDLF